MAVCKSNTFSGVDNLNWTAPNWSNRVTFHAEEYFEPYGGSTALQNLVFVVANATGQGKGVHPIGSGWAFADLAATDARMVKLDNFVGVLEYVTGKIGTPGTVGAGLTDAWRQMQNNASSATQLVHIEAGMEVGDLTDKLANLGLGLPTLGGANGQSVAGAFSTSTHGGDWDQPPLVDCVRAIHLVTDGGRELWIERASNRITEDARLAPVLPCSGTTIVRSDEIFDAALVGFGRMGVIYSLVLEVRRAFRVVEVATMPSRAAVFQALTAGMGNANLFDPLFTLLAQTPPPSNLSEFNQIKLASTTPYFFQLVFNSLDSNDLWVQRRWITSDTSDLNLPDVTPSCLVAIANTGLTVSWLGGVSAAALVIRTVMGNAMGSAITKGRRGPHQILTSGTRAMSHNWSYKADSIEVIFPATNSAYLTFLNTIQASGSGYQQAGYISVRPSRSGRATLSMHNVASAHAISIEVASIKGQRDNETWMQFVHSTALALGGRPHWGQINTLDDHQMINLYGQARRNWQTALNRVSGMSTTFSNAFTRQRGLEPSDFSRKVAAVSQGTDELLVVRIANTGSEAVPVQANHWSPTSAGWSGWKPLPSAAGSPESSFGSTAVDGTAYLFWTGPDGWVYFISRTSAGNWAIWWVVGRSNEPEFGGVPNGAVNAASCQPGMMHVFYAGRHGDVIACRGDTPGGTTWPESIRGLLGGRTAPGGHVTACSRRQGQLDIFTVGTDGTVCTAAWNAAQGWKGWWPIPGVTAKPGTYVAAVSRSLDQIDIFVADQSGRIMSAAWNPTQPSWQGWWQIQAGVTASGYVTAVSRSPNLVDLFTTDATRQVQTAAWSPSGGWGGWWPVSNAKAQSIVWPVSRAANKLDLFFVDPNGGAQTAAWEPGKPWGGPWALP